MSLKHIVEAFSVIMLLHPLWVTSKWYISLVLYSIKNNNFAENEGWTSFKLLQLALHIPIVLIQFLNLH